MAIRNFCSAVSARGQAVDGVEQTQAEAASMDTHGKTQEESPAGPRVCSNGCGFFA
jgi:hypothetical protein